MTLIVLRPGVTMKLGNTDGAKVVYGTHTFSFEPVKWSSSDFFIGTITMKANGVLVTRGIATTVKKTASTQILSSDGLVTAGEDGAVFLHVEPLKNEFQGPYQTMSQVTTSNVFPNTVPPNVRAMEFPFVKVETLDWAKSGCMPIFLRDMNTQELTYAHHSSME